MKGTDASRLAEQLFERYLDERGYGCERHPDLGIVKRPDYLVDAENVRVVCEVKTFNNDGIFATTGAKVGSRSMEQVLAPHRDDIKKAASQLKPLQGRGWPLVVVLSNPCGFPVPTEPSMVAAAMYGDPVMSAPMLDDGSLGRFAMEAGRNGRLRNNHPYISAVVVLHRESHSAEWARRWIADNRARFHEPVTLTAALLEAEGAEAPGGDDVFLDVFETLSESAVPLPRTVFRGPRDRRFVPDASRSAIVELTS